MLLHNNIKDLNIKRKEGKFWSKWKKSDLGQYTKARNYKKFYTKEMKEKVYKKFNFDFQFLGYDFEGPKHSNVLIYDKIINKEKLINR